MATNLTTVDEGIGFVLKRSVGSGFVSDIDPVAKFFLDELNDLLGKAIFKHDVAPQITDAEDEAVWKYAIKQPDKAVQATILDTCKNARGSKTPLDDAFDKAGLTKAVLAAIKQLLTETRNRAAKRRPRAALVTPEPALLLSKDLTAAKNDDRNAKSSSDRWQPDSLAWSFAEATAADDQITLSDYMDSHEALSKLKYEFQERVQRLWGSLDDNVKLVLAGRPAIQDYLVATAYLVHSVEDINALMNFALSGTKGFNAIVDYAAVSAARVLVNREQLKVPDIDKEDSPVVKALKRPTSGRTANIALSKIGFNSAAKAVINPHVFNVTSSQVLDTFLQNNTIDLDAETLRAIRPLLVQLIKNSPVRVDATNANILIPPMLAQARGSVAFAQEPTEVDRAEAEKDFDINLFEDDQPQLEISEAAVKCAAQLFYGMVLGDELDIFNVINFFTHKYLVRGHIEIHDRRLRDDLQMYVFSGKFTDLKTGKIVDRTRPAERHMFYSQVFNQGSAPGADDMVVRNEEYHRLWKVLMLESARYLERAQLSPHPNNFVSKQNVMQAVEDLQYNLSTHCVGMATVISPLIHAELEFVIRRILMRDEVRRQVAPAGGSWWRVVEALYMAMKNTRPKATILYNKAKLGASIIRKVATYNAAAFDNNATFASFISDVDAFITTQSILQEALTDDLKNGDDDDVLAGAVNGAGVGSNGSASSAGDAHDDWDF